MLKTLFLFICCFALNLNAEIKAVVFDFGDVIAKGNKALLINFVQKNFYLQDDQIKPVLNEMKEFVLQGNSEKEFWETYAKKQKITLSKDWYECYQEAEKNSFEPIPETIAIVKELQKHGYQTALLSNVTAYQASIVRRLGYYDLFNPLLLSYAIHAEKPNPEAYMILLHELNMPSEDVVFIDDKQANVEAAENAGIHAILFTDPFKLKEQLKLLGIKF